MIKIRAHHLLCLPRFYRGGYNKVFEENLKGVCSKIRKDPNIKIKVIKECDDVCAKCHYMKENICKKTPKLNNWILSKDEKVLEKLNIKENSIHKARDIFNLSMKKVNNQNIRDVCKGCAILRNCIKVGINGSFKKDLNLKTKSIKILK